MLELCEGELVLATLVGFGPSPLELRARIERVVDAEVALVRTADLRDAGSLIPCLTSRIRREPGETVEVLRHKRGLVSIG